MKPITFPEVNVTIAKDQPEYIPLPAVRKNGITTFCWKLSLKERLQLLFTGKLWHQVIQRGPLQPQKLSTAKPKI